jgi:hypothetical protein
MGWRDRDYAKWTNEERRRFYGSGPTFTGRDPARRSTRIGLRPGAWLAIVVAVVIALGQLPRHHPLIPALHFGSRASSTPPSTAPVGRITGLSTATLGSTLSLHGSAPLPDASVQIEGSYDSGRTWKILSAVRSSGGAYAARIALKRRGSLALKIVFANGSSAVGSIFVR